MATLLLMMSRLGPVHLTGTTPARFQVVMSSPPAVIAVIDIVWGTTAIMLLWSQIISSCEVESTGRLRRRFVYLHGPRSLCV